MNRHRVSVIVVSNGRPELLRRCLTGISQLFHDLFEVVVVADSQGIKAVRDAGEASRIKSVEFNVQNISAARNLGICLAAGDIVAFIDDDAVPEPDWLDRLTAPFSRPDVAAAGGFVRGRNGIAFQSIAGRVDSCGRHTPIGPVEGGGQVFDTTPGNAVKTEGTNCAFRRHLLMEIGGFDPAFSFFMDETDVNMRLAAAARKTAILPLAQVHHGFSNSVRRRKSRMPRTLFDIGASQVVFMRKHADPGDCQRVLSDLRAEQRARLLRHMVSGNCEPRDIRTLLQTLEDGIVAGRERTIGRLTPLVSQGASFQRFAAAFGGSSIHLAGRSWQRRQLRRKASAMVSRGHRVSLYLFGPTALYHRVRFDPAGYWEHKGGLFGKSDRTDPLFRLSSFRNRLQREIDRDRSFRNFTD